MTTTFDDVVGKVTSRRLAQGPMLAAMLKVRDRYNGDYVIPMPNTTDETPEMPTMPAVIANAIENTSLRAGSMMPGIYCPALDPTKTTGKGSLEFADIRKRALAFTWAKSHWTLNANRAFRHLAGYMTTAIDVCWDFKAGRPMMQVRDPLTCVDTETEILTKRGWLRHDQVQVGDDVAGYDIETGRARWTKCLHVNQFDYDGDLVVGERAGLSMRLTPDHRCVVQKRIDRSINRPGSIHIALAEDLDSTHYIPRSAEWETNGEKSIGIDLAALCGWVAAEGHYRKPRGRGIRTHRSHAVYLCQSSSANPQHVRSIDRHIAKLQPYGPGGRRWERAQGNGVMVEWKLSPGLSNEMRRLMPEKLLGLWCLELPEDERQALLDAFIDGDGHREANKIGVFQKYRWNLDVLQMVAVTLGYKASVRPGDGGSKYILYLSKNRQPSSLRARTARSIPGSLPREHYQGTVWCPTTGTGTWFARREGYVFITGNCYPEPKAPEDLSPPCDVAYVYSKSVDWLRYTYPQTAGLIGKTGYAAGGDNQMWDLVEWIDENDIVIGVLGPTVSYRTWASEPLRYTMELRRVPNRAGRCTTYIPRRVTMDRIANQVANMVGTTDLMAKLVSLGIRATEQSIFPDRYIMGKLGQAPQLVGGKWKTGATGEVNIIIDAESVGILRGTPDPHNDQTIDRLERAANISMGVVPQQSGESYGALRTGRGIDSLMGASVDPRIQELHEIMSVAMTHCNEVIAESYKGYAPSKTVTGFSGWATDRGQVSFTPEKHFETGDNAVMYAIPGADVQTATITLGQLYGSKAISLRTFRMLHPYVQDGDEEARERMVEELEDANHAALLQRAAQGGIPPADFARLLQMVKQGQTLDEAILALDKAAQERQARQAPPPQPGMGVAPETMPGLGNPGEGQQMQPPENTVPDVQPGIDHFRQLVQSLRAPNRNVPTAGVQQ